MRTEVDSPQIRDITRRAPDAQQYQDVTTPGTANTEFTVNHGLGRVPVGYLVVGRDKAAIIYNSTTAWTETAIYLKCNVATVAIRLLIF